MTSYVCVSQPRRLTVGPTDYGYVCDTWETVTLQVPNTFEVDAADIGLVLGAIVGSAITLWLVGLGVGTVGRLLRDAFKPSIARDDP
ncbi:hypothetical protein ACM64Y_01785 [Novispirillum sp. DQ9]|uniref:hypothetical protein n=1 Tax=Novispirillum sp. DQ9 TaxID=3398612 RepID=UPI003C7C2EFB